MWHFFQKDWRNWSIGKRLSYWNLLAQALTILFDLYIASESLLILYFHWGGNQIWIIHTQLAFIKRLWWLSFLAREASCLDYVSWLNDDITWNTISQSFDWGWIYGSAVTWGALGVDSQLRGYWQLLVFQNIVVRDRLVDLHLDTFLLLCRFSFELSHIWLVYWL